LKWKHLLIAFFLLIGINVTTVWLYPYPHIVYLVVPFDIIWVLGILGLAIIKGIDQIKNTKHKANSQ